MIQLTEAEHKELLLAKHRLEQLCELCGHIEDGSDTTVAIYQDDETHEWAVRLGPACGARTKHYYGNSFFGAIDKALSSAG